MKRILALLLALVMALSLASCGEKKEPEPQPEPEPEIVEPEPEPEPEPVLYMSPLSGEMLEEDISARRPYAVMLNNLYKALPQCGVSKADMIFEMVVEGNITRMMGLFQDISDIGPIGTVRSSRPYYLNLVQAFDAVYIHAGGSDQAYTDIDRLGIMNLDGVNGAAGDHMFYRDSYRRNNVGYEHSLFTSSELIEDYVSGLNFRKEHKEGYTCSLSFRDEKAAAEAKAAKAAEAQAGPAEASSEPAGAPDAAAKPGSVVTPLPVENTPENASESAAENITVILNPQKTTSFEYDPDTERYLVSEYGEKYLDGNTGEQLSVKNVIVMYVAYSNVPGDTYGRLRANMAGGEGAYICEGEMRDISWECSANGLFFKEADGSPLELAAGNSFVCCASSYTGGARVE